MLLSYYKINTKDDLQDYANFYLPLVFTVLKEFGVSTDKFDLVGDHFGLQVLSEQEFENADSLLLSYSTLIHDTVIHGRRNRVYLFNNPVTFKDISIPRIEIFEPKPGAELKKLKPGIEHVAFFTPGYDLLFQHFVSKGYPIDKNVEFEDGSKFFKTSFVNLVEVEFRNDSLGVS